MATTVTFVSGATTVTLPGPQPGAGIEEHKHQALGLTAGGTRYAYDKGVDRYEVELDFHSLTTAQQTALQSFFHTTVDGVANTWTYTDTAANSYTARFLDPILSFRQVARGVWDVTIRLELDAMGA